MKAKEYNVLAKCVEEGVAYGLNRAYKHNPEPDPDTIREEIERAVLNEICEWFEFEDVKNDDK